MKPVVAVSFAAVAALVAGVAVAAEPLPLSQVSASWAEGGEVMLSVTYEGSACEKPGDPEVTASDLVGADLVTIPTEKTAEVCTMQIVPVTWSGTLPVQPTTERLTVMILDFEGQPKAVGDIEVEPAS